VHESINIKGEVTDMDIKVEEMSVVKVEEDKFMAIKEEEVPVVKFEELTAINIKEEIPWDVTSPTVKGEEDQVSYMCVCSLLDTFYKYPVMPTISCDLQLSMCLSGQIIELYCCQWNCLCSCWVA
jgi:hypothetical protein